MEVVALAASRAVPGTDVYGGLAESLSRARVSLADGDVVVISSKYVACAEGRMIEPGGVVPTEAGRGLSGRYGMDPRTAEVVHRESDAVLGGMQGLLMAESGGIIAPNAGIDGSNSGGMMVLYPEYPYLAAEQIRRRIFLKTGARVGVILADSRMMPARVGTAGVAVACAGMDPVHDARGEPDLDGRPLRVTFRAVADSIATAANHGMGEGAESRPFAIVRGSGARMTGRRIGPSEAAVRPESCIYVRGLAS
ncbi:MAG: coenzyme F420-0:L-glutamate ligase [Nitrosopumilus sp.]|nr:coenzyme F420-0:L-glutamate ligase [Nitrosopumilus sp.]MDA7960330.1 coenzyme F420-0:L-glutamate ligase [Nitrosopumilus sp.]MDA7999101.1 coenzyme F420-0:L-glutamate ligase [Nitrosopumilus sp.]